MMAKPAKDKRYILLDTNIISSFANDALGSKLLEVLREVVAMGYGLAISDITYFELLNEASPEKEVKMLNVLGDITTFWVTTKTLILKQAKIACA
jgi:predicted nucleic acid-binding protein